MQTHRSFFRSVCAIAVPVTLQCLLQSSFSVIDQIMLGQLGGVSVAAVGLAGKFSSIYSVIAGAITAVAGIMLSQGSTTHPRCAGASGSISCFRFCWRRRSHWRACSSLHS